MKGESSDTLTIGGEVLEQDIEKLTQMCSDELSCDFPDDMEQGYCDFYDCCEESLKSIVRFCRKREIPLMTKWDPMPDGGGFTQYYMSGNKSAINFSSDADGNLMVSVDWLRKQIECDRAITLAKVIDSLAIPDFPEFKEV